MVKQGKSLACVDRLGKNRKLSQRKETHLVSEAPTDKLNYSHGVCGVNSIGTAPNAIDFDAVGKLFTLQLDTGAPTMIIQTSVWHRLGSPDLFLAET